MTLEELIHDLSRQSSFLLAIDGMSGSGKTTLAHHLAQKFHAQVFHMDDFFLPLEMRTPERLQQSGGNVHYERFLETVLKPLSCQQDVDYQPFDCQAMTLKKSEHKSYCPFCIVEGSYALHPSLQSYYTHAVVLKISADTQKERLLKRNPEKIEMFINKWIPLENQYFQAFDLFGQYPVLDATHIF